MNDPYREQRKIVFDLLHIGHSNAGDVNATCLAAGEAMGLLIQQCGRLEAHIKKLESAIDYSRNLSGATLGR